ncbi:hypothetical protein [Parasphingopyxis marina]|uniref:Uncharacterized protein n=1 Tax=Parasphingopyxis marina TaxID=2761622 RepID=A0A842HVP3_9SPHN|nr:hypothetical protein [Parasphingopyxis marina]MBC2776441.1 hypothetical protein [Parasphingopyxis marina]
MGRDRIEEFFDDAFGTSGPETAGQRQDVSDDGQTLLPKISIAQIAGIAVFMIAVSVMVGGFTGFVIAAIVIMVAGNLALKQAKDIGGGR